MTEGALLLSKVYDLSKFDRCEYDSSIGFPCPMVKVKIVDPKTHQTVPLNNVGLMCFRSYSISKGYWNDEKVNKETFDSARW
jgi:fatty-acyl-CoA synthase